MKRALFASCLIAMLGACSQHASSRSSGDPAARFDVSDPVQAVEKFYFLWNAHRFPEAYALFSQRYRKENPYAGWLARSRPVTAIAAKAEPGFGDRIVTIEVRATSRTGKLRYRGWWKVVTEGNGWKLDESDLWFAN